MKISEFIKSLQTAQDIHGDVDCRMYVFDNDQEFSSPIDMAVVEDSAGGKTLYVAEFPTFDGYPVANDAVARLTSEKFN